MPDLEAVFRQLDTSGDGLLSIDEMKVGLAKAGHPLSDEDVQKMLLEADEDWDGKISFEEFEALFDMSPETLTPGLAQLVNGGKSMLGVLNKAAGAVRRSVTGGPPRPTDAQLDTVFNLFDTSEDGFLDFYETKEALQKAGHPLSHEDCEQMLADVDCQISIVEFRELFDAPHKRPSLKPLVSAAHIVIADLQAPNIEAIFRAFDTSGDGLISIAEMKAGLAQAGHPLSDDECLKLLKEADESWDGMISLEEFEAIFQMAPELLTPAAMQLVSAGNSIMVGGVMTAFKKASSAVVHKKATVGARPTDAQLDTVFKLLDKSEDGFLDFDETKDALTMAGHSLTDDEYEAILGAVDDTISFDEFKALFDDPDARPALKPLIAAAHAIIDETHETTVDVLKKAASDALLPNITGSPTRPSSWTCFGRF